MIIKNMIKRLFVLLMIISIFGSQTLHYATAASNKTIKKAYAKALENGKIKYDDENWDGTTADLTYAFYDFNWDGVKDLLLISGSYLYGWTYKSGKVKVLVKKYDLDLSETIYCDKKSKSYWDPGEGGGAWVYELKLKNKKLVKKVTYESGWDAKGKAYATKTSGGKTTKISSSKFDKIFQAALKKKHPNFKKTTKNALIRMWS